MNQITFDTKRFAATTEQKALEFIVTAALTDAYMQGYLDGFREKMQQEILPKVNV